MLSQRRKEVKAIREEIEAAIPYKGYFIFLKYHHKSDKYPLGNITVEVQCPDGSKFVAPIWEPMGEDARATRDAIASLMRDYVDRRIQYLQYCHGALLAYKRWCAWSNEAVGMEAPEHLQVPFDLPELGDIPPLEVTQDIPELY